MADVIEFRRYFKLSEIRAENDTNSRKVAGYAAVFDSPSEPIGGMFIEIVRPGAFTKTLQEADVVALWQHDANEPLGRRSNQTLLLGEDAHGLRFELILPDTTRGRDAYELVKRGDIREMSFQFRVVKERWERNLQTNMDTRELLEVGLIDVSLITFPAYRATEVEARAIMQSHKPIQDEQRICAACGAALSQGGNMDTPITAEPGTSANHSEAGQDVLITQRETEQNLLERELTLCSI